MSTSDFDKRYEERRRACVVANKENKSRLFDFLAKTDIQTINVPFDGFGDNGQVEEIEFIPASSNIPVQDTKLEIIRVSYDTYQQECDTCSLNEFLEQLCYDFLEQEHAGWETDEGAFGVFVFDVKQRSIKFEFNQRVEHLIESDHFYGEND